MRRVCGCVPRWASVLAAAVLSAAQPARLSCSVAQLGFGAAKSSAGTCGARRRPFSEKDLFGNVPQREETEIGGCYEGIIVAGKNTYHLLTFVRIDVNPCGRDRPAKFLLLGDLYLVE